MQTQTQLELSPSWQFHLGGSEGAGGTAPTAHGIDQGFTSLGARFYVVGPAYGTILNYLELPILENTGKCSQSFSLLVDSNVAKYCQCLEFDLRLSLNKYNYNCSFQWNNAAGGALQISDGTPDGDWVNTGFKIPVLATGVEHQFELDYEFDTAIQKYSFYSMEIDGVTYDVPESLQNITAYDLGWEDGVTVQVQIDLDSLGGQCSHIMQNHQLTWN